MIGKHATIIEPFEPSEARGRLRFHCADALAWMREQRTGNFQFSSVNKSGFPYGGHGDTPFLTRMQFIAGHDSACFTKGENHQ